MQTFILSLTQDEVGLVENVVDEIGRYPYYSLTPKTDITLLATPIIQNLE